MAVTIKNSIAMINGTFESNILAVDSKTYNTPVIIGTHGIGKSQTIHTIAKAYNGFAYVLDATTTKEGEVGGMPFATENEFGGLETTFAPHWILKSIQNYEDAINGSKPELAKRLEEEKGIKINLEAIAEVFGIEVKELTPRHIRNANVDQRVDLISKRLLQPSFILLDEINRCSREVNQEMMNFVLNRTVNGYDLPWYVQVIGAANPSGGAYSAEDMDPAQIDRMFRIDVVANVNDWIEWGNASKKIHKDVLTFIADSGKKYFQMDNQEIAQGSQKANVSPRSWEAVSKILFAKEDPRMNRIRSAFNEVYTSSDNFDRETEIAELIAAKVGDDAQVAFTQFVKNIENRIKPSEIFTKDGEVPRGVKGKINKISSLRQQILVTEVLEYLQTALKGMVDSKDKAEAVDKALEEFYSLLDESNKLILCTGFVKYNEITKIDGREKEGKPLFTIIMTKKLTRFTKVLSSVVKEYSANVEEVATAK